MRYRRVRHPGATYFFTLVTDGRRPLFGTPDSITDYQAAVAAVRASRPFEVEAQVILPDHLHVMWSFNLLTCIPGNASPQAWRS